jgi:hypothetical protein
MMKRNILLKVILFFWGLREGLQWKSHSSTKEMRGIVAESLPLLGTPK